MPDHLHDVSWAGLKADLMDPVTRKQLVAMPIEPPAGEPATVERLDDGLVRLLTWAFGGQ